MAGRPIARRCRLEIEQRATAEELTPLEYVAAWIESGQTLKDLADDIGDGVTRPIVSRYVNGLDGAAAVLASARVESSHVLAEETISIVDEAGTDRDEIALAKLRAERRAWLASKLNRRDYGDDKQTVAVQVNVGSLALDAMRTPIRATVVGPHNVPELHASHTPADAIHVAAEPLSLPSSIAADIAVVVNDASDATPTT